MRRTAQFGSLLLIVSFGLTGCLLNTPSNVTKRFVGAMSKLNWEKMEKLVDWKSTEQAFGRPLSSGRKNLLMEVAEGITRYDIEYYGEEQAGTKLLYLKVKKTKVTDKTDDRARVEAEVTVDGDVSHEVVFMVSKVGRTWRVVLTPNLLNQ